MEQNRQENQKKKKQTFEVRQRREKLPTQLIFGRLINKKKNCLIRIKLNKMRHLNS